MATDSTDNTDDTGSVFFRCICAIRGFYIATDGTGSVWFCCIRVICGFTMATDSTGSMYLNMFKANLDNIKLRCKLLVHQLAGSP